MLDCLLVTLSPLFLEDDLHLSFCMLHDCSLHLDVFRWNNWVAPDGVLSGTDLVDFGKGKHVTNADVFQTGNCKQIPGCKKIFATCDGGDDIL